MRIYIEAQANDRYLSLEEKEGHELVFASEQDAQPGNSELVAVIFHDEDCTEGCTTVFHGPLPAEHHKGRRFGSRRSAIDYCIREFLFD